jgi:predicted amidophosphoribosyltransferase
MVLRPTAYETTHAHKSSTIYIICNILTRLTLNLLTTTIVAPPSNASKWQMGFNSAFKGLKCITEIIN